MAFPRVNYNVNSRRCMPAVECGVRFNRAVNCGLDEAEVQILIRLGVFFVPLIAFVAYEIRRVCRKKFCAFALHQTFDCSLVCCVPADEPVVSELD